MPKLPDFTDLGERPVPQPQTAVAQYEPPNWRQVGIAGQIVSGAGRELEQASQIIAETNDRQDQIAAQAALNKLNQNRVTLEFDPNQGFRNIKEGGAVGAQFVDGYMGRFGDSAAQLRDSLLNDHQRQLFDQRAQVSSLQFRGALLEHQSRETDRFNDSTADGALNNALQTMATRPQDELGFQTGLVQINKTIDDTAQRKGLPPEQVKALKNKYLTAAYTTRITSLMDGIPGVVPANPYRAEQMFRQVQDQLDPVAQVHLAAQVQKAVQSVQQRDTAQSFVFGAPPTSPASIAPFIGGKPLEGVVRSMESGGNMNAVSPKGATSDMQVMPGTALNPGYGVRPAQPGPDGKISQEEISRVGSDYLGAMSARYGNPALIMAAYNAGPARVDQWIAQYGDPRTGDVSAQDWVSKIPFAETQAYVTNGLKKLAANATGNPQAQIQAPTVNQLKTDLYARVQAARALAEQQYPGDTAYADGVAARVENYGRLVLSQQQAIEAGARDGLFQGLAGANPNGSDRPTTIDQLLTDPQQRANWDKATPETKLAIQQHFKGGAGDPPRTAQTQATLYQYMGKYANDREGFASEDLSPLIPLLPHADFDKLATLQMAARNKQELAADKAINLQHALTLSLDYALKPIGISMPDKNTPQKKRDQFDQFTGALRDELDQFQQVNKRRPSDQEIVTMARNLTTTVQTPGRLWGTNDIRAFEISQENQAQVTAKIPNDFRAGITQAITARTGKPPTEAQVQTAYIMSLRQPPRAKPQAQSPTPAPAASQPGGI